MSKNWYVLRVQSGREETVARNLQKRIKSEGLEAEVCQVVMPTRKETEIHGGRRRTIEKKTYPGYLMVELDIRDDGKVSEEAWFIIRETPGIGDFVNADGKPIPMQQHEVERMLGETKATEAPKEISVPFDPGDKVRIKEGAFENFEGLVEDVDGASGKVKVTVTIFGRSTPVELNYWQVERY